ncbi:ABC transporter ATP-binding protein [Lentzea jiangxiensis]|uniref:ABC-type multidrug transport system, ATPase component n=1 Tax=Lentzea jiangxiensis TaxID=641025 RepID=A0A1H0L3J8_9PSEU|nr:ABC transporter ATP-binding protein [Lentzea jiangxiensis]SDO62632.1 ABC-type multidrug transport system, ATPase component [Lentzea jiangxiensis]
MTAPTTYAWEVEARDLEVRAGRRTAVDGVTLHMGRGVHGLLGPNGAGKTTLIRALATVLKPARGELRLLGGGNLRETRKKIGYLPQEFGHYRRFTVREFVAYVAWLKEVPDRHVPAAVQRAVDRVGLADRADDRLRTLSGGMLKRVGIAQAIVNDPEVVLLDEPTAGLDPAQRLRFRELLTELGTDACVVVSTHLVEDVAAACTDVLLMDRGKLVFRGTPAQLVAEGADHHPGDSPIERGYSAVLAFPDRPGTW